MAFRPKLWLTLGAALTLVAACGEQGAPGETGGEAGATSAASGEGEGGEGEGGSAAGEAGAAGGYAGVPAESLPALRIAHLEGFFLVARRSQAVEGDEFAAALAGQGLAEVYDPQAADFEGSGLDLAVLRRAAETGSEADLTAAVAALEAARTAAGGNNAVVAGALSDIAAGIYQEVLVDGAVDPVEYQHSLGAALAAQQIATAANLPTKGDIDALVAMWHGVVAPEEVAEATPAGQVQAQASRIRLASAG